MMKGKVSVDMFKELSRTEKNIEEYSKQPVSVLTGMLSGWLFTGEEEKTPARLKLEQLVETCESLVLVEEILGVSPLIHALVVCRLLLCRSHLRPWSVFFFSPTQKTFSTWT